MIIINLKVIYLKQDTYIEKDTQINEKIEKLRLEATAMLLSGEPTIIISTVSCIYSLGSPKEWEDMAITLNKNEKISRTEIIKKLINARYERNDVELIPGNFRVKGDTLDVIPAYSQDVIRISLFGDEIEKISILDNVSLDGKKRCRDIQNFSSKALSNCKRYSR